MNEYFGIRYEFDREETFRLIDQKLANGGKGFICVADGVVLTHSAKDPAYGELLGKSMFSVCDSNWVPVYLRMIHGKRLAQYSGSELFEDVLKKRKYKMMFLGASDNILQALRRRLVGVDPRIDQMSFVSLPFCSHDEFDFEEIAKVINRESPDIVWVGLGAPKQEHFMYRIQPFINRGVLIGVGAVFKFYSGIDELKRAPRWMIKNRIEWLYRLMAEPGKQSSRIFQIIRITPSLLLREYKNR